MNTNTSKRSIGAASIGNFGEIYDFAVFGFSAPFLAAHFFPASAPGAAMLMIFATYAVAFVARPVGGLLFGYLLDTIGRVRVLAMTIWMMAAGTALMGILPDYDTLGIAAPILLMVCRFLQGLALGGESTGSAAFILESAPDGKRGLWVGIITLFANVPNCFVALMLLGLQALISKESYQDWGWRIPFLMGGLIGIVGYWLRRSLDDPEEYKQAARATPFRNPLRAVTRSGLKSIMHVAMIIPVGTVSAYLLLGFTYTFLVKQIGVDSKVALFSNAAAIAVFAAFLPIGGALSDRFGRKPILFVGTLWIGLFAYPAIRLISHGTLMDVVIGQLIIAVGSGLFGGASFVAAVELFPTSFRATGHAIAFQLTVAVFGGTSPFVNAWLVSIFHSPLAPGLYVTIVAAFNFILIFFVPETRGVDLRTSVDAGASSHAYRVHEGRVGSRGSEDVGKKLPYR